MNIKIKLVLVVLGSMVLFGLAVASYFLILSPIDNIQHEQRYFTDLATSTRVLDIEANRLVTQPLDAEVAVYQKALDSYNGALKDIDKVQLLRKISPEMAQAVEIVANLGQLSSLFLTTISDGLKDVQADVKEISGGGQGESLFDIVSNPSAMAVADNSQILLFHVSNFVSTVRNLNQSLDATIQTVVEKDQFIVQQIDKLRVRSVAIAGSIAVLIVAITLVFSFLVARSISKSVIRIETKIKQLSEGDFTGYFGIVARDEIGVLARNLDRLLDRLNESLSGIQSASRQNIESKNELVASVSSATSSATEIEANSESIRTQMENMDRIIADSVNRVREVAEAVTQLSRRILEQNSSVETSVSAVTEMLASVENISRITKNDQVSAEALVTEADRGREVFDDIIGKISEITESISGIQEMASVISGIASQTNILAMNAAIEAAHAGEFGKGFAVVADEISKLAAASDQSSREINETIKVVTSRIGEAASARGTTLAAFNSISTRIKEVSANASEIHGNINEMQTGSRQILEAMEKLRALSGEVTTKSASIEEGSSAAESSVNGISRISQEVVSNIGEISTGLREISSSIRNIAVHSERVGEIGVNLDVAVNQFKTRTGGEAPETVAADESITVPVAY